eukprot:scaffold86_cov338-Pavlova_lutheri.AAC.14
MKYFQPDRFGSDVRSKPGDLAWKLSRREMLPDRFYNIHNLDSSGQTNEDSGGRYRASARILGQAHRRLSCPSAC